MFRKFFKKNNFKLFLVGLVFTLVCFFRFFFQEDFLQGDYWKIFIFYGGAFFLLPWGIIHFFFQQKTEDYFWGKFNFAHFEKRKVENLLFIFWIGFFGLIMLKSDQWKNFPISPWILGRWELVLFLDFTLLPLILFFQEFFYRGFLLKIFSERLNLWGAVVFQALLAIGFETFFIGRAFLVGIVLFVFYCFLGWVSWRQKNFLYSWWLIFLSGLFFDLVVKYKIFSLLNK